MILKDRSYNKQPKRPRPNLRGTFPCPAVMGTTSQFHAARSGDELSRGKATEMRAMGMTPPAGMSWSPQLNQWIDGPDDVKRICKANGSGCTGSVNVAQVIPEVPDKGPYRVADEVVQDEVDNRLIEEDVHELPGREYDDLTEKVREEITPVMEID